MSIQKPPPTLLKCPNCQSVTPHPVVISEILCTVRHHLSKADDAQYSVGGGGPPITLPGLGGAGAARTKLAKLVLTYALETTCDIGLEDDDSKDFKRIALTTLFDYRYTDFKLTSFLASTSSFGGVKNTKFPEAVEECLAVHKSADCKEVGAVGWTDGDSDEAANRVKKDDAKKEDKKKKDGSGDEMEICEIAQWGGQQAQYVVTHEKRYRTLVVLQDRMVTEETLDALGVMVEILRDGSTHEAYHRLIEYAKATMDTMPTGLFPIERNVGVRLSDTRLFILDEMTGAWTETTMVVKEYATFCLDKTKRRVLPTLLGFLVPVLANVAAEYVGYELVV